MKLTLIKADFVFLIQFVTSWNFNLNHWITVIFKDKQLLFRLAWPVSLLLW